MRRPKTPETETKPTIKELLKMTLEGAEIIDLKNDNEAFTSKDFFEIKITDKEKWQSPEEMEKLVDLFGDLIKKLYGSRENPPTYDKNDPVTRQEVLKIISNPEGEIGCADSIIVAADQDKIISFIASEKLELEGQENLGYLALAATTPEERNKGYGTELLKKSLEQNKFDAVLGISHTPAMIEIWQNAARETGYTNFFCGHKDGIFGDRGTPQEQKEVARLHESFVQLCREEEVLIEGEMPPGYIVVDVEIGPIPPLQAAEVKFPQDSPLKETFEKGLLPTQAGRLPHTVYGIFLSIKEGDKESN